MTTFADRISTGSPIVVVASIIILPVIYLMTNNWLENYTYRKVFQNYTWTQREVNPLAQAEELCPEAAEVFVRR